MDVIPKRQTGMPFEGFRRYQDDCLGPVRESVETEPAGLALALVRLFGDGWWVGPGEVSPIAGSSIDGEAFYGLIRLPPASAAPRKAEAAI